MHQCVKCKFLKIFFCEFDFSGLDFSGGLFPEKNAGVIFYVF
jgi:hypothetical protein